MFGQKFLILPDTLGIVGLLEPLDKVGVEGVVEAHVVVARQHVALRVGPGVKHRAKPSVRIEFLKLVCVYLGTRFPKKRPFSKLFMPISY